MNKINKIKTIKLYQALFSTNEAIIIIENSGLTANYSNKIRRNLRKINSKFIIVKNTLMKKIFSIQNPLKNNLKGSLAIAYSNKPIALFKEIIKICKNKTLNIIAGIINNHLLNGKEIESISKLQSQDHVRFELINLITAIPNKLIKLNNNSKNKIFRILKNYNKQILKGAK